MSNVTSEPTSVSCMKRSERVPNLRLFLFIFIYVLFERRLMSIPTWGSWFMYIIGFPRILYPVPRLFKGKLMFALCRRRTLALRWMYFGKSYPTNSTIPRHALFPLLSWFVGSVMQCCEPGIRYILGQGLPYETEPGFYFRIIAAPTPDPVPAIFISELQDGNKTLFLFAYYFQKVPYIYKNFQRLTVIKKSQNSRNQSFSHYFSWW